MGFYDRLNAYVSEGGRRLIEALPQSWIDALPPRIIERSSSYQEGVNKVRTAGNARLRRIVESSRDAIGEVKTASEAESRRLAQQYLVTALRQEGRIRSAQSALVVARVEYKGKLALFKQHYGGIVCGLINALRLEGDRLEFAVDARAREVERDSVQQNLASMSGLLAAYVALEAERGGLERELRLVRGGLDHKVDEARRLRISMRGLQQEVDQQLAEARAELLPSILTAVASTSSQFNDSVCVLLNNRLQPVYPTRGFLGFFGMTEQGFGDLSRSDLFQHLDKDSLLRVRRQIKKQKTGMGRVTAHFDDDIYNLGFKPIPFVAGDELYGIFVILESHDLRFREKRVQSRNTRSVTRFLENLIETLLEQLHPSPAT